ncbi:hypothetical protein FOL47_002444, partial [Perkinsus chesapeaki]
MDSMVGDFPFVKCYLDDLLIFSTSMTPDIKKVDTILRWPTPTSPTELRSLLGLANYYRGFLPHYSARTRPLYDLLTVSGKSKKPDLDVWSSVHEAAFMDVKEGLAALPLLSYPDFVRPFQLITDASDIAIGSVLEQDGRPVSFFSQSLTETQKRWPVYEREAFAIFRSLEKFRNVLLGYPLEFIVFTDHKPLTFMQKFTTPKVQRWILSLCQYSFTVQYRPGKENVVADALSRIPSARSSNLNDEVIPEALGPAAAVSFVRPFVRADGSALLDLQMAHSHGQASRDRVAFNCPFEKSLLVAEQREDPLIGLLRRRLQRHRWRQEDWFDPRLQPYKSVMCLLAVDED